MGMNIPGNRTDYWPSQDNVLIEEWICDQNGAMIISKVNSHDLMLNVI